MTELAEESRTRQGLYRLTGASFRPPESESLSLLAPAVEFLQSRDLDRFAYAREWRAFAAQVLEGLSIDTLETEYVRLFGVGVAGTPATPTESFYRVPNRDGGVGDFVAQIQGEYRKMGLSWAGSSESPDHISTELDVMSYLCGVEADALEMGSSDQAIAALTRQRRFLDRHLAVWVPRFVEKAHAAHPSPFYKAALEFLHSFVVHERNIAFILVSEMERA
jgi:TorA maturation chaperone TorD